MQVPMTAQWCWQPSWLFSDGRSSPCPWKCPACAVSADVPQLTGLHGFAPGSQHCSLWGCAAPLPCKVELDSKQPVPCAGDINFALISVDQTWLMGRKSDTAKIRTGAKDCHALVSGCVAACPSKLGSCLWPTVSINPQAKL